MTVQPSSAGSERPDIIGVLRSVHSALDKALGDSDATHIENDDELRDEYPVQWAAQWLMQVIEALEEQSGAPAQCPGCDGHECDKGCQYPGAAQRPLTRDELAEAIHRGRFKDREPTPFGDDRLDREYAFRIADSVRSTQAAAPQPASNAQGVRDRDVIDPTDPTFVKDQAHRERIEKGQPTHGAPKTIMEAAASAADKISLWSNSKQGYANRIVPQPSGGDKGEVDDLLERLDDQGLYSKADRIQMIKDAAIEIRRLRGIAYISQQSRLAERLTDVIAMLDTPDAYNRGYIAAVCRSILSSVSSTESK